MSTVAFTACFAVWTIFSIIGVRIKQDLGLNDTEFGLLVATPILTGSLTRIFLGIWTDQYGGRLVFTLVMILTAVATWLLSTVSTYPMFLLAALGVGLAGGSFAVGIAYVSRWYPKRTPGHGAGHFRCRQCRCGRYQFRRAFPARGARLAVDRQGLCDRSADHGGPVLPLHQRGSVDGRTQGRRQEGALDAA